MPFLAGGQARNVDGDLPLDSYPPALAMRVSADGATQRSGCQANSGRWSRIYCFRTGTLAKSGGRSARTGTGWTDVRAA